MNLKDRITNVGSYEPRRLEIIKTGDSVLRQKTKELTKKEILSTEIQQLIQDMKLTMRVAPGVGLAAPQIGKSIQLVVIEDADHSYFTKEEIAEMEREIVNFHVIINPKIYLDKSEMIELYEGCLSVPYYAGVVPRARSVRVECLNEKAEPCVIEAKGWYARILQHEIDHLNGTLYLDKVLIKTLSTEENCSKWKRKK